MGSRVPRLSATKSTAFASGGNTVFARFVATFARFDKTVFTVFIALLIPPSSKDFLIVFTASLTGF